MATASIVKKGMFGWRQVGQVCVSVCVHSTWLTLAGDGGGLTGRGLREHTDSTNASYTHGRTIHRADGCYSLWAEKVVYQSYYPLFFINSTMFFLLLRPGLWDNDAFKTSTSRKMVWRLISHPQGPMRSVRCQWIPRIRCVRRKWRWESRNMLYVVAWAVWLHLKFRV